MRASAVELDADPHVASAGAPRPAPARSFTLSDSATTILRLCAAHDGVSEVALVTRLVCQHAERVGLPGLLDGSGDVCAVPPFERPNVKRMSG